MTRFRDRQAAGRALAASLVPYGADALDVLVLALPRGGVPVASEAAQVLSAPLDVFLVRKLGALGREELALGALASGGVRVMNDELVRSLRITEPEISAVAVREEEELLRRERLYRGATLAARCRPHGHRRRRWAGDGRDHAGGGGGVAAKEP